MAREYFGSLQNRMQEDRMYCDEIKVGTGMTEYSYSDRRAYEVIEVIDQKHVIVRLLDHIHEGDGVMDNRWKLVSNESNPTKRLARRGKYWYYESTVTVEDVEYAETDTLYRMRLLLAGFDFDKIRAKGAQTKYFRANVSFGVASYHIDYEF